MDDGGETGWSRHVPRGAEHLLEGIAAVDQNILLQVDERKCEAESFRYTSEGRPETYTRPVSTPPSVQGVGDWRGRQGVPHPGSTLAQRPAVL